MDQKLTFGGSGMDMDNDLRDISPGDSPFRMNALCDMTIDGNVRNIYSVRGNTLVPYTQPAGVNKVIGSCSDWKNNAIVFFVYNSAGSHEIRRWIVTSNTIDLVYGDPLLNFQPRNFISCNMIGDLIYYTDGYFDDFLYDANSIRRLNPPRKLNQQKALDIGNPGGYTTIDFQTLDRLKWPPQLSPEAVFAHDPSLTYNYIAGKLHQFTAQHIFDDNEESVWSPLSKILYPAYTYGALNSSFELMENTIELTVNTGHETVRKIKIATRVNSFFRVISVIDKDELGLADNVPYTITYDGVGMKEVIPIEEFLRPYDYIGQVVKRQELIGNRLIDGNFWQGYDKVDLDVVLAFERYDKLTYIRETSLSSVSGFTTYGETWGDIAGYSEFPLPNFKSDEVYQVGFVYYDEGIRCGDANTNDGCQILSPGYYVNPVALNGMLFDPVKLKISINHTPPPEATHYQIVLTKGLTYKKKQMFVASGWATSAKDKTINLPINVNYSFEPGDRIRLVAQMNPTALADNIPYYNIDNFVTGANGNGGYLPIPGESNSVIDYYNGGSGQLDFEIEEFNTTDWKIVLNDIDASNLFTNYVLDGKDFPKSSNYFYVFEIYNKSKVESENNVFYEVGSQYEIGDAHLATRYHKGEVQDQVPGVDPAMCEVYGFDCYLRYKKYEIDNILFFEESAMPANRGYDEVPAPQRLNFEMKYESVLGTADLANSVLWDVGPAYTNLGAPDISAYTVENDGSDYMEYLFGTPLLYPLVNVYGWSAPGRYSIWAWVEDESFTDAFPSTVYNDGRIHSSLDTTKRRNYESGLRFGGKYFQDTLINNLSRFEDDDYRNLPEAYNEINMLRFVGFTLQVKQRNKVTSIYIDRNILQDSVGNVNIMSSDRVLNQENQSETFYGSISPGSDAMSERLTYWVDLLNGIIGRAGANGITAISGNKDSQGGDPYKLSKYIKDLCDQVLDAGEENFDIIGTYDFRNASYIITFKDNRIIPDGDDVIQNGDFAETVGWVAEGNGASIVVGDGIVFTDAEEGASGTNTLTSELIEGQLYFILWSEGLTPVGEYVIQVGGVTISPVYDASLQLSETGLSFISPVTSNQISFVTTSEVSNFTIDYVALFAQSATLSQTIMFHEPTNRWKTFLSHIPEWYANHGQTLVSFKDGALWTHYTNPVYNNFYGVQYETIVDVVFNAGKDTVKVFDNIDVYSEKVWDAPELEIDPTENSPNGMLSKIPKAQFVKKEGVSHAKLLRNMLSSGHAHQRLALRNGDKMRGDAIRVRLTSDEIILVTLKSVVMHFTPSNLTA